MVDTFNIGASDAMISKIKDPAKWPGLFRGFLEND
jgi:hypothetical protein